MNLDRWLKGLTLLLAAGVALFQFLTWLNTRELELIRVRMEGQTALLQLQIDTERQRLVEHATRDEKQFDQLGYRRAPQ